MLLKLYQMGGLFGPRFVSSRVSMAAWQGTVRLVYEGRFLAVPVERKLAARVMGGRWNECKWTGLPADESQNKKHWRWWGQQVSNSDRIIRVDCDECGYQWVGTVWEAVGAGLMSKRPATTDYPTSEYPFLHPRGRESLRNRGREGVMLDENDSVGFNPVTRELISSEARGTLVIVTRSSNKIVTPKVVRHFPRHELLLSPSHKDGGIAVLARHG